MASETAKETTKHDARTGFFKKFVDHPASVDETYLEHARFAFGFSIRLFLASLAALVHAVIPPLFETTAGRMVGAMNARLQSRHTNGDD